MGMSIATASLIPLAAAAGVVLPLLLLRCGPRPGRGWCRRCQTPDLWVLARHTGRSRAWAALTWLAHAGVTASAVQLARTWSAPDPRDWAIFGLLLAAEVLIGHRSRLTRRRVIRCRMCESEAEPRELRRTP
jgi:hypothetical protein